ncbi:MAG TPA: hypothetical protein VL119_11010 [Acidimicrobiia bacterium]|nr:hypothetical protein [Acidimicrobiia bacterium]
MSAVGIRVARALPIDGALLGDVLLRFRRDASATALRWTLGGRGTIEIAASFTSQSSVWTTTARLWHRTGRTVTPAVVRAQPHADDEVAVSLEAAGAVSPIWGENGRDLEVLANAALDELVEELLWYATRAGFTHGS